MAIFWSWELRAFKQSNRGEVGDVMRGVEAVDFHTFPQAAEEDLFLFAPLCGFGFPSSLVFVCLQGCLAVHGSATAGKD